MTKERELIASRRDECLAVMAGRKPCDHDTEEVMSWYVEDIDLLLKYIKRRRQR